MIKVTKTERHEHIGLGENEIILSGPPSSLRGPVILQNSTDEHVFVRELPLKNAQNANAVLPFTCYFKAPGNQIPKCILFYGP